MQQSTYHTEPNSEKGQTCSPDGGRIEHLVLAGLAGNLEFADKALSHIKDRYFKGLPERVVFVHFREYIQKYNTLPNLDDIQVELERNRKLGDSLYDGALEVLDAAVALKDARDLNWLLANTEQWCKERAIELALMHSIDIVVGKNKSLTPSAIPELLNEALKTGFNRKQRGICAADVEPEDIRPMWWPYLLCGKMHVVASQPNRGKGLFVMDIAARITTGREWPLSDEKAPLGSVIWCESEDTIADILVPRAIEAGADLKRLTIYNDPRDFAMEDLGAIIRERDVKLLVMSPAVSFLPGLTDPNDEMQTREALGRLQKAIDGTDCAVIFIMHPNKKTDMSSIERIMGSRAWTGFPRSVLVLDDDPDHEGSKRVSHGKWNNAVKGDDLIFTPVANPQKPKTQFVKVQWSKAESNVDVDAAFDRKKKASADEKPSAGAWLVKFLKERGEVDHETVMMHAVAAGFNKEAISKAHQRNSDCDLRRTQGFPSKTMWFLKSEMTKPSEASLN